MNVLAIKLRWKLRRHVWFWATIIFVLILHIPFLYIIHWPQSNVPTIIYALPLGIVDFFLITGALTLAERVFSKDSSE
jgi:peptidoglycan/LPS O-acetylase OafA/YrhL